ncbi:MAG TPA: hypothetical protein EYN91_25670 [Candidatus Melainabacteria bacterium]|nr:hypothetical protein [Candidatus Melainabacteria bacterium]
MISPIRRKLRSERNSSTRCTALNWVIASFTKLRERVRRARDEHKSNFVQSRETGIHRISRFPLASKNMPMRRTFLTTLSRMGVPLRTVQEMSGHSSLSQLQAYLAVDPEDTRDAVHRLRY